MLNFVNNKIIYVESNKVEREYLEIVGIELSCLFGGWIERIE
jgi:hypothetical protein